MGTVDKLAMLRELKIYLQTQFGDSIKEVILFGSQAYGQATDKSDYDVLIIIDKEYNGWDENLIFDLCYDIDLRYDIVIDAHVLSSRELTMQRGRQPIFIKAINSGIHA